MFDIPKDREDLPVIPYGPLRQPTTTEEEQLLHLQYDEGMFIENSPLYNDVIIKLRALVESFIQPIFSVSVDDFQRQSLIERQAYITSELRAISFLYKELIKSSSDYLKDREGFKSTASEEARFRLIENICDNAKEELKVLNNKFHLILFFPQYFSKSDLTYKDILKDIRTEVIDITGRADTSFTGGNTSSVLVIGEGEQQRFFKGQDVLFDPDPGSEFLRPNEQGISATEKEKRKKRMQFGIGTMNARINIGEELSKRNVATSRLAIVLRAPELVVKAHSAKIIEEGKPSRLGIIMSKAKGGKIKNIKNDIVQSGINRLLLQITPEAKRQFSMLQLLDWISGQVDRHSENYCINYEISINSTSEGAQFLTLKILSIEGIDNDMSFGQIRAHNLIQDKYGKDFFTKQRVYGILQLPQLQEDLSKNLPYIDKEFAENILVLSRNIEMIDFIFRDLLSQVEIIALKGRLLIIADTLRRYTGFLLSKNEWETANAQKCFAIHPNLNYMSKFMHYFITNERGVIPY